MKEFDKILWGFIFSVIGIAFGWMLNQVGQWFRTRQEDKKNLKVVLYNLLETYFIFIRSDFDKFVQKITDKVHSKIPVNEQTPEMKMIMQSIYTRILIDYLKPELIKDLKVIQEGYQDSIKTLATIDPLTAYYLNGKTKVIETFDNIQNLFDNLKEQFPNDKNEIEIGVKQVMETLKPDLFQDTLNDLEMDIRDIAWKINPYVWFKSTRMIKRLKLRLNERLDNEIDELFTKLMPMSGGQ
ncbi:hypothetical protein [Microbacter margulisiae]|uniref:Uncharacterized protein n=1 Tax=Microbacter margulisiae TaxID=1350067 RepID=A0A7W5DPH3_9PORP|nr:hypothetical protein [Microbacter margulisiae]MBB3186641.1 hypothetical protein [Microbacter margulisiae]